MCVSQGLESTTNIWVYFSRVFLQTPSVISSIEKKAKIAGTFSGFVHDISNCSPSKNSKQYFKFCILLLDGCCEGVCFDNSKRPVNMPADESRYPNTLSCLQECSAYTSKMKLIVNEMTSRQSGHQSMRATVECQLRLLSRRCLGLKPQES